MRKKRRDDDFNELLDEEEDEGITTSEEAGLPEEENFDEFEKDDYYDEGLNDDFLGEEGRSPMDKHSDLLKGLTNFDPYIQELFREWLGLIWSEEKQDYIPDKDITPVMSVQGAKLCKRIVSLYARNNNIITNIGKEEYSNIISDLIEAIWLNIGTRDDVGITNDGELLCVANELQHASELALMGAGDGKYTQFLGTTISRSEQVSINPQMQGGQPGMGVQPVKKRLGAVEKVKRMLVGE